jgi:hypothetical protein
VSDLPDSKTVFARSAASDTGAQHHRVRFHAEFSPKVYNQFAQPSLRKSDNLSLTLKLRKNSEKIVVGAPQNLGEDKI